MNEETNIYLKVLYENLMSVFSPEEIILIDGGSIENYPDDQYLQFINKLQNKTNLILSYVPEALFQQLSIPYEFDEMPDKLSSLLESISLQYRESVLSNTFSSLAEKIRNLVPILENASNQNFSKNLVGRDKTIANTFIGLGTRPYEYKAFYRAYFKKEITHCELCGAKFFYHFHLKHKEGLHTLNVGGDCIVNFIKKYVPEESSNIESIIEDALHVTKLEVFKEDNPNLDEDIKKLYNFIRETRNKYSRYARIDDFFGTRDIIDIAKECVNKKYTSKPKLEKFKEYLNLIDSGVLIHKLEEQFKLSEEFNKNGREKITNIYDEKWKQYIDNFLFLYPHHNMGTFSLNIPTPLEVERLAYRAEQKKLKDSRKRKKK